MKDAALNQTTSSPPKNLLEEEPPAVIMSGRSRSQGPSSRRDKRRGKKKIVKTVEQMGAEERAIEDRDTVQELIFLKRIEAEEGPECVIWHPRAKELLRQVELEELKAGLEKETKALERRVAKKIRPSQLMSG